MNRVRPVVVPTLFAAALAVAGALMLATPGIAEMLPDGGTKPVVVDARVEAPHRSNELLEADLVVDAYDDGSIVRIEYRWNRATKGRIQSVDPLRPTVDFSQTLPSTRYVLEVRAVDDEGWRSDWYVAFDGDTPQPPNLVVAGDSIASGYERQWFSTKGTCVSPNVSYGEIVRSSITDRLPAAWAPNYRNVARAGAGVYAMTDGGEDPCGAAYTGQVAAIMQAADPATWNIVVITAGINSTNWGDVVGRITQKNAFSFGSSNDDRCREAVTQWWNLADRADAIAAKTAEISEQLTSGTNARLYWTSYYSLVGSGLVMGWSPIGETCRDEMADGLGLLHSTLRSGLTQDVTWIDIDRSPVSMQDWGGWPHPDRDGHRTIGAAVADAIN